MCARRKKTARRLAWLLCLAGGLACAWGVGCVAAQAERAWVWQNPLPQGNAIYAVRFASDKRTGWAVGADGVILHTEDGGFRWEEQHAPAPVPLYGLYVRDARRAVAVGSRGLALTTDDGGRRWTLRPTNPKGGGAKGAPAPKEGSNHLFSVAFAPDGLHGWAVGSYGEAVRTSDGGRTWAPQASGVRAHLFSVAFADASNGVAVGGAPSTAPRTPATRGRRSRTFSAQTCSRSSSRTSATAGSRATRGRF
ncbi:MAG: hypothetical protein LC795_14685 [Acidobacteria bacterium]|nr:hypothetical protein [Acidobacteriota bacterium]